MKTPHVRVDFSRHVVCVMGLPFDVLDLNEAVSRVRVAAKQRTPLMVSTANLNFVIAARTDEAFRDSVIRSELSLADGMPIVWVARLLNLPIRERLAGSGLFEAISRNDGQPAVKVYFFGGPEGVAEAASHRINQENGGVSCVGFDFPGYVPVDAMSTEARIQRINSANPDFVVVSLGAKKGQDWIERNRSALNAPVISHLGAVVNFAAGSVNRAPMWMQRYGLEWLWRIKEEPALWKRYASDGVAFAKIIGSSVIPLFWSRLRARSREQGAALGVEYRATEGVVDLKIAGSCDARQIDTLRSVFAEAAKAESRVRIDLSDVVRIDAMAMGTLLLLHGHQREIGRRLELLGVSPALRRQFEHHLTDFLLSPEVSRTVPLPDVERSHA